MVFIHFPSIISKITNEKTIFLDADTLEEIIDLLVKKYGQPLKNVLFDQYGDVNRYFKFFLNGLPINEMDQCSESKCIFKDDDEVALLLIISGG